MPTEHIAFFSFPHYPDVNPTLAVVQTLVRRGFRVTYVTSDRFAGAIANVGAEHVPCPRFVNPFDPESTQDLPSVHPAIPLAERTLADTASFYEGNRPDLIVYDYMALTGRILARRWNTPAIQTSPAFAFDSGHLDQQLSRPEFREEILTESGDINRFLERHLIADGDFPFYREKLNVYFYPKLFQLPGNALDDRCFYAGRCAPERPYARKWQPRGAGNRPILLVSTSTGYIQGPDYYRMCIRALTGLKWHVVLAIGENNDPAAFEPLSPHFEIVQNIPQIEILPHTDLLICLGGMITTVEAMYHGVPMLMMTHGRPEPEAYADNSVRLGIGKHLRHGEANEDAIRSTLLAMSEDASLYERVRKVRQIVIQEPGAEDTANRITEYLRATQA